MRPAQPVLVLMGMALAAELMTAIEFHKLPAQGSELVGIGLAMAGKTIHHRRTGMVQVDVPMGLASGGISRESHLFNRKGVAMLAGERGDGNGPSRRQERPQCLNIRVNLHKGGGIEDLLGTQGAAFRKAQLVHQGFMCESPSGSAAQPGHGGDQDHDHGSDKKLFHAAIGFVQGKEAM